MFILVFDEKLKERLIKDQHKFLYEGTNEKGTYSCFEMQKRFNFAEFKEGQQYIFSNRMIF